MATLFFMPARPAFDSNARLIPGAQAWFTLEGTNTPAPIYSDVGLTTPHANPVVANAVGRFPQVYLSEAISYRVRIYDDDAVAGVDTPIEEYDPYGGTYADFTFIQSGAGAVPRTGQDKLRETVSVKDYGATGDGATNDSAAIQAALDSGAREVQLPPGDYLLGDNILRPSSGTRIVGTPGQSVLKKTTTGPYRTKAFFDIEDESDISIEGIEFDHIPGFTEHALIVRATALAATKGIALRNCVLKQCHVHIERYVEGVTIEGNRFLGNAVALAGVATGCQISKVDGTQIVTDGVVNNVTIRNNYFERTVDEAVDINWHTQNAVIDGNTCVNCDYGGANEIIDVGGDVATTSANQCRNITITNNKIVNDIAGAATTVAIHIKGRSNDVIVADNVIVRTNDTGSNVGIRIWNTDDTIVRNNCISGYASAVTSTDAGENLPQRCLISGNIARNFRTDAFDLRGSQFTVEGNEVDGTGAAGMGFDLLFLSRSVIRGNKVTSSPSTGFRAQNSCADLTFANNRVSTTAAGQGFDLQAPRSIIEGNSAELCANHGFSLVGVRLIVRGNMAFNNGKITAGGDGFVFGACDFSIVSGNTAFDNQGTKTQDRGFVFGASDRVKFDGNISYGNTTDAPTTASLTNSHIGVAGNITA